MTRLILIRHAVTADTGKRLTGRLPGVALSPPGRAAAASLGRALGSAPIYAVFTSPMLRCRQTAALVASPHGLHPQVHPGLTEVDYGAWSGRTLLSLRRTARWRLVHTAPSRAAFPGGEALLAVQGRAVAACEALALAHPKATLALVSHGDVIRVILAHYLGMPFDLYPRIEIAPASVSIIDLTPDAPARVTAVNTAPGEA